VKRTTSDFQEGCCSSEFVPYSLTIKSQAVTICTTMFDVQIFFSLPLQRARVLVWIPEQTAVIAVFSNI